MLFTRQQLGDLYVYVGGAGEGPHGVCVNGCTLSGLSVKPATVSFTVATPFAWPSGAEFVAVVDGATTELEVVLNGKSCGKFTAADLKKGVRLAAAALLL